MHERKTVFTTMCRDSVETLREETETADVVFENKVPPHLPSPQGICGKDRRGESLSLLRGATAAAAAAACQTMRMSSEEAHHEEIVHAELPSGPLFQASAQKAEFFSNTIPAIQHFAPTTLVPDTSFSLSTPAGSPTQMPLVSDVSLHRDTSLLDDRQQESPKPSLALSHGVSSNWGTPNSRPIIPSATLTGSLSLAAGVSSPPNGFNMLQGDKWKSVESIARRLSETISLVRQRQACLQRGREGVSSSQERPLEKAKTVAGVATAAVLLLSSRVMKGVHVQFLHSVVLAVLVILTTFPSQQTLFSKGLVGVVSAWLVLRPLRHMIPLFFGRQ